MIALPKEELVTLAFTYFNNLDCIPGTNFMIDKDKVRDLLYQNGIYGWSFESNCPIYCSL